MNVAPAHLLSVANFAATQPAAQAQAQSPAHAEDVAKFRQSFADAKPPQVDQSQQATASSQDLSPGIKSILSQFDSLNGHANQLGKMAESMRANGNDLKPGQIIDMTLRCHELVFQAELTSNVANRSSEGVQQLFREQS